MTYEVYLNSAGLLEAVDTRDDVNMSTFLGKATASWKSIITKGRRSYYGTSYNIESSGLFLLSYGRGDVVPVNASMGDYIPPGYTCVSCDIDEYFASYSGRERIKRAKLVPMPGEFLMNKMLRTSHETGHISRGVSRNDTFLVCWYIQYSSTDSWNIRLHHDNGRLHTLPYSGQTDDTVVASQIISANLIEGATEFHVTIDGETDIVLFGTEEMTLEDGVWKWSGDPVVGSTAFSFGIDTRGVRGVEVVHVVREELH